MKLELVPIQGEKILTEEEKERLRSRTRPIPPVAIEAFSDREEQEIKDFLVELIIVNEQLHHDKEHEEDRPKYYARTIKALEEERHAMFQDLSPGVARFVRLLDLFPLEPWGEIKSLLEHLRKDAYWDDYETKRNTGIEAALDNPFLLQQDDLTEEENMQERLVCRTTPDEVSVLVEHFSLQDLVKQMIKSRKCIIGGFWDDEHFDL